MKIPRCLLSDCSESKIEICGFADTTERACAACVYVRGSYSNGHVQCIWYLQSYDLPLKYVTLSELKFCAMVLLSKLV